VGSQILAPGGPPIMIFGTPVTLAPSATLVIIGCSTNIALRQPANPLLPANTIDGAMPPPIDPHTTSSPAKFSPAAPASPSPKAPSGLRPQASTLIIGITTIPLKAPTTIRPPDLTFAGQTITANSASNYISAGKRSLQTVRRSRWKQLGLDLWLGRRTWCWGQIRRGWAG